MKFSSWNVNGLRSVWKKGFLNWIELNSSDFVSLQETKISEDLLTQEHREIRGYHSFWHSAQKPGYSGVAIYARKEPHSVKLGVGIPEIDLEGRVLSLEYPRFTLVNAYFPNSGREHLRLGFKETFCSAIHKFCTGLTQNGKHVVLCGDFNIAHQEIDLKNPKSNQNNAGFLPQERAWMSHFLGSGFSDPFREKNSEPGHYTWWSYRPGVREKNVGWRLDYHCVNSELMPFVKSVGHQPEILGSDHCPVYIDVNFS